MKATSYSPTWSKLTSFQFPPESISHEIAMLKFQSNATWKREGLSYISFHPETSKIIYHEEGYGKFSFQLQLYPDHQYSSPYSPDEYPIQVHLQDRLYFEATVSAQNWLQLFIDSCVATESVDPNSSPRFEFIQDG